MRNVQKVPFFQISPNIKRRYLFLYGSFLKLYLWASTEYTHKHWKRKQPCQQNKINTKQNDLKLCILGPCSWAKLKLTKWPLSLYKFDPSGHHILSAEGVSSQIVSHTAEKPHGVRHFAATERYAIILEESCKQLCPTVCAVNQKTESHALWHCTKNTKDSNPHMQNNV